LEDGAMDLDSLGAKKERKTRHILVILAHKKVNIQAMF
jgi:hypothetical protein